MVIAAWDMAKMARETQLAQLARIAATASKIAARDFDLVRWAEAKTAEWPDPAHRARALARVAVEAGQQSLDEQATRLLLSAMLNARLAGRAAVLEVLATAAEIIAAIDGGNTLLRLYHEYLAVDQWMTASATGDPEARLDRSEAIERK